MLIITGLHNRQPPGVEVLRYLRPRQMGTLFPRSGGHSYRTYVTPFLFTHGNLTFDLICPSSRLLGELSEFRHLP